MDKKNLKILRVSVDEFKKGWEKEYKRAFKDSMSCPNQRFYTKKEKSKITKIKRDFSAETSLYIMAKYNNKIIARSYSNQERNNVLEMCISYVKKNIIATVFTQNFLMKQLPLLKKKGFLRIKKLASTAKQ